MLQTDADLSDGEGRSWVLQLCCPKARLVPRNLCLHWIGVATLLLETLVPLRPQPTCKKKLSCCSKGDKTRVYFSSMQVNSLVAGKPGCAPSLPRLPSVTQVSVALPTDQNWLVGDQAGPAPALGTGAACDGSVPAGA